MRSPIRKENKKTISSVVASNEDFPVDYRPVKKYSILHGKCSHITDNCKDLYAMVKKHKQKKVEFQVSWKEQQGANCVN